MGASLSIENELKRLCPKGSLSDFWGIEDNVAALIGHILVNTQCDVF